MVWKWCQNEQIKHLVFPFCSLFWQGLFEENSTFPGFCWFLLADKGGKSQSPSKDFHCRIPCLQAMPNTYRPGVYGTDRKTFLSLINQAQVRGLEPSALSLSSLLLPFPAADFQMDISIFLLDPVRVTILTVYKLPLFCCTKGAIYNVHA